MMRCGSLRSVRIKRIGRQHNRKRKKPPARAPCGRESSLFRSRPPVGRAGKTLSSVSKCQEPAALVGMIKIPVLNFGGRAIERYRAKRCQPAVKGTDHTGRAVDHIVAGRTNCALAVYSAADMRH
jgi:hypothetical protein